MAKVLKKIIINWVEYNLPSGGGGGGGTDTTTVNAIIDLKLRDYDSLFAITTWLYKILNDITDEDELGLTEWENRDTILADATSMSKISHSYTVMCYAASSSYAFGKLVNSNNAMKEVSECRNSITIIAENEDATNTYVGTVLGLNYIFTTQVAYDAFIGTGTRIDTIDNALANLNDANFASFLEIQNWLDFITTHELSLDRLANANVDTVILPAVMERCDLSGYSTFADLASDDSTMALVQSNTNAMLIIESNDEAREYLGKKVRYIKRDITAIKSNVGTTQASEFELCDANGNKYTRPSGVSITANYAGNNNEGIEKLIDGSVSTKYCTGHNPEIIIIIDLWENNKVNLKDFPKYKRYTANDTPARDPNTWTIQVSNDNSNWETVSSVSNANVTSNRNTLAGTREFNI